MNTYEQRQKERRERLEQRAKDAQAAAARLNSAASQLADAIPFGQPILVGHHSEKRDRNYRERIHNKFQAAYEAGKKAEYYADKADSVGKAGISSDDPDAVDKLTEKLHKAEQLQDLMKRANAIIRKHKAAPSCVPLLVEAGLTETQAWKLLKPDFAGRIGFPDYATSNNNAEIRRIKQRIASLETESNRDPAPPVETETGVTVTEEDNRVCIRFPAKPDEATRTLLKSQGFKFSPTRDNAWVRMANNAGRYAAQYVLSQMR